MNFIRRTVSGGCIEIGGAKLNLADKLGDKLAVYEGKDVVFGFRPEAIALGENEDGFTIRGTVELTEMLGDNVNVYVDIDEEKAILKVTPFETPELDSGIVFSIPQESVYLFDAQTEEVI